MPNSSDQDATGISSRVRSWLFVPGGDDPSLDDAPQSGADVLIQELEDFTPPDLRPHARHRAEQLYDTWRAAGMMATVRINPLAADGLADLTEVMKGRPDAVHLPKVRDPADITDLDAEITKLEAAYGIAPGATKIVPNLEAARGIMQTFAIATCSPRVIALLCSTEDLALDLGAPRTREGHELAYCRQRMHVETTAAGKLSIDCPYTFSDAEGCRIDTLYGRSLGYSAKAAVSPQHARVVTDVMTPSDQEIAKARAVIGAFEAARQQGLDRVELDGHLVEVPSYTSALQLIARARSLAVI